MEDATRGEYASKLEEIRNVQDSIFEVVRTIKEDLDEMKSMLEHLHDK